MFKTVFAAVVKIVNLLTILLIGTFCVLRLTGHVPYIVQSGSMSPVISTGAVAFVNTNDKDVEVGDIITYTLGAPGSLGTGNGTSTQAGTGQVVTHRLIAIEGDSLYTKGDANDSPDLVPVNKDKLIGTYMFQIPKLGFILAKTGKLFWFLSGGMILFLNIAAALFKSSEKNMQADRETIQEGN